MGSGELIDDLIESGTLIFLDWNDSMTDIRLGIRFVEKVQAISTVQKWSIQMDREYRVIKSKSNQWTAKCYYHSDSNYFSRYIRIKKKAMHSHWEITKFVKEHTCLVQVQQNKHRNMSSKFISMSMSHNFANDPEISISNVIQEVQVLSQMGCTYKRAWVSINEIFL
ncbi:hypothetical protein M9H77_26529 [Catharanthus roseus]|uniref:Uncharacterized protein n=1 Tax=Catharanthus roseus TaxID=4058 RepID=A0ACC0ADZ9_CATRO|nr:hypothetical protein M9H77_26529 [Catharanthus roseus]